VTIAESIDRINKDGSVMTRRFYEIFFEKYPEVRPYFDGSDLGTQAVMLTMALNTLRHYPEISEGARMYLRVLGTKHSRRGVPLDLYPKFLEALMASLEEFHGADWDESLAREWRAGFGEAIEWIQDGYERRYSI
jgi:hemoglobin-like flavoprotein